MAEFFVADPCDKGSFHDITNNTCKLCPKGEYQDTEGQTRCIKCPSGHTTVREGAASADACLGKLLVNMFD